MKFKIPASAWTKATEILTGHVMQSVKDHAIGWINSFKDRFMFTMTVKDDSEVYYAFQEWFYHNYNDRFKSVTVYNIAKNADGEKVKNNVLRSYHDTSGYSFDIGYSQNAGSYAICHGGVKIHVTKGVEQGDKTMGEKKIQYYTLVSTDKPGLKALVEQIYEEYNSQHDQIKIFVSDLYGSWNMVKRITGKSLENIVIEKSLHNKLVNDLVDFEGDREWYEKLNIPYKRGYLFEGPPGNGRIIIANNL